MLAVGGKKEDSGFFVLLLLQFFFFFFPPLSRFLSVWNRITCATHSLRRSFNADFYEHWLSLFLSHGGAPSAGGGGGGGKKRQLAVFLFFFFLRSFPFRCILVVVEWCAVHSSNRHNNDLPSAILCALHFVWFLLLLFLLLLLLSFSLAATAKCCGKYTAGCAATRRSYSTHCARPHEFCAIAFTFCQPRTKAKKSNERTQTALIKSRHGAATETRQQPMSGLFPPFVPFYIHRCQYLYCIYLQPVASTAIYARNET